MERARRLAEQHGDLVGVIVERLFERGNRGGGLGALGGRLLEVEIARRARLDLPADDLQAVVLNGEIVARDLQARLGLAQVEIGEGDFGDEAALHVRERGGAAFRGQPGGLGGAREAAENVRLPARIEPGLEIASGKAIALDRFLAADRGAGVELRQSRALGGVERGAGGAQPRPGGVEIVVPLDGAVDERGEQGIVEAGPPLDQGRLVGSIAAWRVKVAGEMQRCCRWGTRFRADDAARQRDDGQ
jgi:hypothetical protein